MTLAVVNGKRGLEVGSTWRKFMDAFMNVFPEKANAQMISSFDELRQTSEMAAFIPEHLMAAEDAGMKVRKNSKLIQDHLHFIKATATGFDKRIRRKHPTLVPMCEHLQDHLVEKEGVDMELEEEFKAAKNYDKKIMAEVAKINHDLIKSRQKQIKFYGSYAEVADIANVNDAAVDPRCQVCSVQEGQVVTKDELVKFQAELRNETQATIQSAVAAVRTDIVGDVKGMFESLSAKMDKDKEERMQAQPQRFDRRDDNRRDDRGYPRKNAPNFDRQGGRAGNSSYNNGYANQRPGGNREYPAGSGQRNCHICGLAGHPFMRCPHFHDPKYAEQKELAFKKI